MSRKVPHRLAPKTIRFGKRTLSRPTLFASYRLGDYPTSGLKCLPWDVTRTEALLINAYDLLRPKYRSLLSDVWLPCEALRSGTRPVMVDSGAYYFVKHNKIDVNPEEILAVQQRSRADVAVALDHPFPPSATDKAKRIDTTIKNTEIALRCLSTQDNPVDFLPVLHGHTRQSIRGCIKRIEGLYEKYSLGEITRVGIGSVAPLAQGGNSKLAVDVIHSVRTQLPDCHVHCFSMGSALLMLLAFYCGADTVDSQTWIVSAGFKYAQLPGHHVMRMGAREYKSEEKFAYARRQFSSRLRRLVDEEGFYGRDWITGETLALDSDADCDEYVTSLIDVVSNENVHNRACHNLWVYNFEVQKARDAIEADRFDSFVSSRLADTKYVGALEYARSKKQRQVVVATDSLLGSKSP